MNSNIGLFADGLYIESADDLAKKEKPLIVPQCSKLVDLILMLIDEARVKGYLKDNKWLEESIFSFEKGRLFLKESMDFSAQHNFAAYKVKIGDKIKVGSYEIEIQYEKE